MIATDGADAVDHSRPASRGASSLLSMYEKSLLLWEKVAAEG